MEKIKENRSRYQELAIPRERFDRNTKVDPFKVKLGALSYRITDSLNTLARPRKITFEDETIDPLLPPVPKILPIKSSEKHAMLLTSRGRIANTLTSRKSNQLDLDTYAQMVKRGAPSYRISDLLNNPIRPRRKCYQVESSTDYLSPRASNVRGPPKGGKCEKIPTNRLKNRLNLDAYAEMVVNNDKQCSDRIKNLARPRRSSQANWFDMEESWMGSEI